ncbi:hypothetical protein ONZ43_g3675 [Nemania bipapillata]|uniref:Uncharacterized protein n=1 Tax=Nemania bipapillata TaxID=110536 RepID=A0ACC2IW18_9PEZI|nr:hypothetical protein ONZ43_g3675 [Nemania bipapillata]
MAETKETKKGLDDEHFDESLLDPRLRSDSEEAPPGQASALASALTPALLRKELCDRMREDYSETKLPDSAYTSLDFFLASPGIWNENERSWLIGLQTGIGLGIAGAREAILNEMQWDNTVFGRPIQSSPSDPDPHQIRMQIGQSCLIGFDRRVAYRSANHFLRNCRELADTVVQGGLIACLPEVGYPLAGTSMFFSDEDVARCYENYPLLDEAIALTVAQSQLNLGEEKNSGVEQLTSPTASSMGDGPTIAGVDITQIDGASALVANTARHEHEDKGEKMSSNKPKTKRRA